MISTPGVTRTRSLLIWSSRVLNTWSYVVVLLTHYIFLFRKWPFSNVPISPNVLLIRLVPYDLVSLVVEIEEKPTTAQVQRQAAWVGELDSNWRQSHSWMEGWFYLYELDPGFYWSFKDCALPRYRTSLDRRHHCVCQWQGMGWY